MGIVSMATKFLGNDVDIDILSIYARTIENKVRNYCHLPADRKDTAILPEGLELLIAEMVVNYYKLMHPDKDVDNAGQDISNRQVKSIRRGDTTIDYGDNKSQEMESRQVLTVDEFVSNYYRQLWTYRRMATLGD